MNRPDLPDANPRSAIPAIDPQQIGMVSDVPVERARFACAVDLRRVEIRRSPAGGALLARPVGSVGLKGLRCLKGLIGSVGVLGRAHETAGERERGVAGSVTGAGEQIPGVDPLTVQGSF